MADITKIRLSGQTYNLKDESALHTLDSTVTSGGTNAVQGSGIYSAIETALQSVADQHYQTSGDVQSAITEAVSGKADLVSAITDVGISTTTEGGYKKVQLTSKKGGTSQPYRDIIAVGSGLTMNGAQVLAVDFTTVAELSDIPSVSGYADSVKYDSNSKEMKFYNGGTGGTEVFNFDASPFIIDGMVENVEIKDVAGSGTCLVVSFNTDAGKQDINIPISQIFDASNYYTTAQTDSAIEAATSGKVDTTAYTAYTAATDAALSGKQDTLTAGTGIDITNNTISVTGVPLTVEDNVTSGSSNPVKSSGIYNFVTGETSTKQDTLVSGTNIKTVGTNSLLGSGNIALMTARVGTDEDANTLIFEFA